jgi:uncharacterized phage protein gp47/JayE
LVRQYERDYLLHNPGAKVGQNTLPGADARTLTDMLLPLYAEAARIGGGLRIESHSGDELEAVCEDYGVEPSRLAAVGASGLVQVQTVAGGEFLVAGTLLQDESSGLRYQVIVAGLYDDGDAVPVAAVDTGPDTDQSAGARLKFVAPPPGVGPYATVIEQVDGSGLSGGRPEETDDELRQRFREQTADPAAGGNVAEYRQAAASTPSVRVEAAFVYPAIMGPGTVGMAVTMAPAGTTGDRVPTSTDLDQIRAHVVGKMPGDDGLFMYDIIPEPVDVDIAVQWAASANGWNDIKPWPPYHATAPYHVTATSVSPLTASVAQNDPGRQAPSIGTTIAFWTGTAFVRKTVVGISGAGTLASPWILTFSSTNSASDGSYIPTLGDRPTPWAESLIDLVDPVRGIFAALGPSDHVSFDVGGLRRRRSPAPADAWPTSLTSRSWLELFDVPSVREADWLGPALPRTPVAATVGVSANLLVLGSLRVYALS